MTSVDLGTPYLRCERRGALMWCTIDRPKSRNALTSAMYYGIRRAAELANESDEPTALVITGEGDVFPESRRHSRTLRVDVRLARELLCSPNAEGA